MYTFVIILNLHLVKKKYRVIDVTFSSDKYMLLNLNVNCDSNKQK